MILRFRLVLLVFTILLFVVVACVGQPQVPLIDLNALPKRESTTFSAPSSKSLVFAVAAVNSPQSTFDAYQDLARYLGDRFGMGSSLVANKTYAEINSLVRSGDATVAMVCTLAYVVGHDEFGMEALVVPVVNSEMVYRSYLIVQAGSALNSWRDLEGQTFAFTDPMSNSGRLAPLYQLWTMGQTPSSFFSRSIFTYSHDNSIKLKRWLTG